MLDAVGMLRFAQTSHGQSSVLAAGLRLLLRAHALELRTAQEMESAKALGAMPGPERSRLRPQMESRCTSVAWVCLFTRRLA